MTRMNRRNGKPMLTMEERKEEDPNRPGVNKDGTFRPGNQVSKGWTGDKRKKSVRYRLNKILNDNSDDGGIADDVIDLLIQTVVDGKVDQRDRHFILSKLLPDSKHIEVTDNTENGIGFNVGLKEELDGAEEDEVQEEEEETKEK